MFWISAAQAYTPPIGIPDPGFGIDDVRPSRPADWSAYVVGYYYIDLSTGNNTTATSNAGGYGTPTWPRLTIPSPVPAGSYVEVHGTDTSTANLIITVAGTSAAWVAGTSGPAWIVGQSVETRPDIHRKFVVKGSYGYFDTLYFSGGYGSFQVGSEATGYAADHIVLRNSESRGAPSVVRNNASVAGEAATPSSYVVMYNNLFHYAGDITANYDQDVHATTIGMYTSHVWILENTIHDSSGSGTQLGGNDNTNCHHIYFGKNHIYNTRAAGLAVKWASDVVFSQNTIHDQIDTRDLYEISASPGKGIGMQYEPQRIWVLFNHIYNSNYGLISGSTDTSPPDWYVYVIGNVIHDINDRTFYPYNVDNLYAYAGAIYFIGVTNKYIINNTIYNVPTGIYCAADGGSFTIENNIIMDMKHSDAHHVWLGGAATNSTLVNNILYQSGADVATVRWGTTAPIRTIPELITDTAAGDGCVDEDPLFVDLAGGNFHLQASSPAVDTGALAEAYATFQSAYGIDIKKDIDEATRPINTLWDIGAYEYNEATAPQSRGTVLLGQ